MLTFQDVAEDASFLTAVQWGVSNGIITGYSDTVFRPGTSLTREQFAVMLYPLCRNTKAGCDGAKCSLRLHGCFFDSSVCADRYAVGQRRGTDHRHDRDHAVSAAHGLPAHSWRLFCSVLRRWSPTSSGETDAPKPPQTHSYTAFTTKLGDVTRSETEQDLTEVHRATRRYTDSQGCAVEMGHSAAVTGRTRAQPRSLR